ncbi:hypothetical protein J132_00876 [Termitomyces sp. J132]|nr:hypothetical protein H2248_003168 [Termitomyces sp. 'cryptogamus']KNZ75863.1 hypothetical protein J132_00876 [Termitomyces sp. J132]
MANPQIYPLEVNPKTGEPFLRLRNHQNIILTPPRPEDALSYLPNMNDPHIYKWLGSPPFPFLPEHAEGMYEKFKVVWECCQSELEAARESQELVLVGNSPVRAIREVREDDSDIFLGDISITRAKDGKLLAPPDDADDEEKTGKYMETNMSLPVGNPNIIWSVGYYLIPSYHGRGIMTDALQTLLWDWAVPRMGVRHIITSAFEGNEGSFRVFQKNGLKQKRFIKNYMQRNGQWRNLNVVEWKRSDVEPPNWARFETLMIDRR